MGVPGKTIFETLQARDDHRAQALMHAAIKCADRPLHSTAPNPRVGCVISDYTGDIIAEGWHDGAGTVHAEAMALASARERARGAIAFVTLEPCNHTGRTAPCVDALIQSGIAEVVFAIADPNPVAAGGAARLRDAGVIVTGGFLEHEARIANRAWLKWVSSKQPYVVSKVAMSLDGRIATAQGESQWITNDRSRQAGHLLRMRADAIITGADTVIADDPALTARLGDVTMSPLRVVLDTAGRTSPSARVFEKSSAGTLLIATDQIAPARADQFREHGVEVLIASSDRNARPDLAFVLSTLGTREIVNVMLECGGVLNGAFFDAGLVDEYHFHMAPKVIGGGSMAFGGTGIDALAQADQYSIEPVATDHSDFHFRAIRKEAA